MIFILEDDDTMARCIARATKTDCRIFTNAIEAMECISNEEVPELIFLDILLDGPDGFSFLNEIVSYPDTEKIPIVIVSSLNVSEYDLSKYGVIGVLNKDTMIPEEIEKYAEEYAR